MAPPSSLPQITPKSLPPRSVRCANDLAQTLNSTKPANGNSPGSQSSPSLNTTMKPAAGSLFTTPLPPRVTRIFSISTPIQVKRSEEHTSELQSRGHLVCRLLLEKKKY